MSTIFNPGPCFPDGSVVKNLLANAGNVRDTGLIPGSGRSLGEGNGKPLNYSCVENSMDRGVWQACSPWDCKRVGHDFATKQQQQRIV